MSSLNVMVLFKVPSTSPSTIPTQRHPVKVGLSDAYYVDKPTSSGNSGEALRVLFSGGSCCDSRWLRSLVSSASSKVILFHFFYIFNWCLKNYFAICDVLYGFQYGILF